PNIQDDIDDSTDNLAGETTRYLSHVESKLYADIQARKRIDSGLLFLACQISSCSLSWLLFQLQITLLIIQVSSACLALLPGLIDIGDSFNFQIDSQSWQLNLGDKPLVGIVKLLIGSTVSFSGTSKITKEVMETQQAIAQTYSDIRSHEGLNFQLPSFTFSLLLALAGVGLIGFFKKVSTTNQENKNNDQEY
ncbi:MAG: hypothetical protein ACKPEQ_43550, partial [Dolichospermum sp.]